MSGKAAGETLSQEEQALIIERLRERGAAQSCELCAQQAWQIGDRLVTAVTLDRRETRTVMDLAGVLHPSALLVCQSCGNSKTINLGVLKLAELFPRPEPARLRF